MGGEVTSQASTASSGDAHDASCECRCEPNGCATHESQLHELTSSSTAAAGWLLLLAVATAASGEMREHPLETKCDRALHSSHGAHTDLYLLYSVCM